MRQSSVAVTTSKSRMFAVHLTRAVAGMLLVLLVPTAHGESVALEPDAAAASAARERAAAAALRQEPPVEHAHRQLSTAHQTAGWSTDSSGRHSYPPVPTTAPQVLGAKSGTGAASHKTVAVAAGPARVAPAAFLNADCKSSAAVRCVRAPLASGTGVPYGMGFIEPTFTSTSLAAPTASTGTPGMVTISTVVVLWGDFDNDGDYDLFLGSGDAANNEIWTNSGAGVFTQQYWGPQVPSVNTKSAALVDVNGDGHLDIFVGNGDGANNELWFNGGGNPGASRSFHGSFTGSLSASGPVLVTYSTSVVLFGDVNGDGCMTGA